jgi:hypothetical protein
MLNIEYVEGNHIPQSPESYDYIVIRDPRPILDIVRDFQSFAEVKYGRRLDLREVHNPCVPPDTTICNLLRGSNELTDIVFHTTGTRKPAAVAVRDQAQYEQFPKDVKKLELSIVQISGMSDDDATHNVLRDYARSRAANE